jgi:hypothetical protein
MQTTEITPELKHMNRYWLMLSAMLNELGTALNQGDMTPEEQLAKIRLLYDQMVSRMPTTVPPSVATEALAREVEQAVDDEDGGEQEVYYRRTANGFAGPFTYTAEHGVPYTPEEDAIMQADWERDLPSRP